MKTSPHTPYKNPRLIDLFAGCGGLSLGFKSAGFEACQAVEIDPDAAETYRLNVDDHVHIGDVAGVCDWPQADVVVGGPPCQGFSLLGNRDPEDPRNELWRAFLHVVEESEAVAFVLENVPQFLNSDEFTRFERAARRRGFHVASDILCAADYGVPQMRFRCIVIGSKFSEPWFPEETHGPNSPMGHPYVTVKQAFQASPPLPRRPDGDNWHRVRAGIKDFSLTRYAAVPANGGTRLQMQERLKADGLEHLIPPCWRRRRAGGTDVFGRLWWDRPALTIRTEFYKPEKGRYLHPVANRPITAREAARLQSFPDSFAFPEDQPMTSVARQIGNAVPPLLAEAVARALADHLSEHGIAHRQPTHRSKSRQLALVS